jgi:protein-tyrosine-phosphatase
MAPYARAALEVVGVYIEGNRARQVDTNMLEEADLVSAMAPEYAATLPCHFPESLEKIHTLPGYAYGVPDRGVITDPYGLLMSDYRGSVRRSFECVNLLVGRFAC